MASGTYNPTIDQGADWSIIVTVSTATGPVNLSGYSGIFTIGSARGEFGQTLAQAVVALYDAPNGKFSITLSGTKTAAIALPGDSGTFPYDFFIINPSGTKTRLLYGNITFLAKAA